MRGATGRKALEGWVVRVAVQCLLAFEYVYGIREYEGGTEGCGRGEQEVVF